MGYMHFQDIQVFQLDQLSKSKLKIMDKLIKYIIESKFNFNIDIEDNSSNNTLSKSTFKTKTAKQMYETYAAYVDFKLPSGKAICLDPSG